MTYLENCILPDGMQQTLRDRKIPMAYAYGGIPTEVYESMVHRIYLLTETDPITDPT